MRQEKKPEKVQNKIISALSRVKIKGADLIVIISVAIICGIIILPSIFQCAYNHKRGSCERHMFYMLHSINDTFKAEEENGGTYWHDLLANGNYQRFLREINNRTRDHGKFSSSDYYIRVGVNKITVICKEHRELPEKSTAFSLNSNFKGESETGIKISDVPLYLFVSGPDTYYKDDSLNISNPEKKVFEGSEVNKVIQNLTVKAVYPGGYTETPARNQFTVTAKKLDMSKTGDVKLMISYRYPSIWQGFLTAPFIISVLGDEDATPLLIDCGINGRYELAQWDWHDFVEEARSEGEGKDFDASIVRFNGRYYYYPDGFKIVSHEQNNTPLQFAKDIEDESRAAYYIPFDTDSIILNSGDEVKAHNGSVKAEDGFIYIYQEQPSKELPEGWIRVYCDLKKY